MVRQRLLAALAAGAAFSVSIATPSFAQIPIQPTGPGPTGPDPGNVVRPMPQQVAPMPAPRERWREMSPDDRQRLGSNAERWLQLNPDEQKALRNRENNRKQRLQRETEEALRRSGLELEAGKREAYEKRYIQERRRIERELRQELQERRQREIAPVVERLKKEFTQSQGNGGANSASPSPKK